MADETKTGGGQETTQTGAGGQEKTFTQAQVDAIIGERLSSEREKYADYETLKEKAGKYDTAQEAEKTDLQRAQEAAADYKTKYETLEREKAARDLRDKVSKATGVPADLLTGDTEEAMTAHANAIKAYAGDKPKYGTVPDGGEKTPPPMTKAEILAIKNERERLKAIREHIDLFK